MTYIEQIEEQLKKQIIPQTKKEDFESFWETEITKLRSVPVKYERRLLDLPYKTFTLYSMLF